VIEVLIGFILLSMIFDHIIGRRFLLEGRNEMAHPVAWTWYSTYLILVNLAKGIVHAIVRIITMLVIVITQVCMHVCMCVCVSCRTVHDPID
jgi:hypothetical protein